MTARTVSPTFVRDDALTDLHVRANDVAYLIPLSGPHVTTERLDDIEQAHKRQGTAIQRLREAQERCDHYALRGMRRDIGPSSFEWGWEQG